MITQSTEKLPAAIAAITLLTISYFAFFFQPETRGLLLFDESRQAASALEMSQSGNVWVTTVDGKPDMWSTKPPLFIWLTALSLKIFGLHVWALRLPAALAGLALTMLLFRYILKKSGNLFAAFFSAFLLATAPGFIGEHAARTADYDSLLVLFTTLCSLAFLDYTETLNPAKPLLVVLFFCLAFLTKSIAACFILPGLFVYAVYTKTLVSALKNRQLYIGLILAFSAIAGYYIIRENHNPGYMRAVMQNEWGGRFNTVQETSNGPWHYYFTRLGDWRQFSPGFYFLLPFAIASFYAKGVLKKLSVFSLLMWVSILVVISAAASKLPHYALPMYPFMVITLAIGFYVVYTEIKSRVGKWSYTLLAIPLYFILCGAFYLHYFFTTHNDNTVDYGHAFDAALPITKNIKTYSVGYNPGLYYYTQAYTNKGLAITNCDSLNCLVPGDTVITCPNRETPDILPLLNYTLLNSMGNCKTLVYHSTK